MGLKELKNKIQKLISSFVNTHDKVWEEITYSFPNSAPLKFRNG